MRRRRSSVVLSVKEHKVKKQHRRLGYKNLPFPCEIGALQYKSEHDRRWYPFILPHHRWHGRVRLDGLHDWRPLVEVDMSNSQTHLTYMCVLYLFKLTFKHNI